MKSIKELLHDADPLRYETEIPALWKTRTRQTLMKQDIFTTGTCVSDSKAWIGSLIRQIKEFLSESRNPTPRAEITAAADPNGLKVLVDPPNQMVSLWASIKSFIDEKRHPRHIDMTATPVEVEELWAKRKYELPGVLSLLAHVGIFAGLIYISVAAQTAAVKPKVVESSLVLQPLDVKLPPAAAKASGGGGGGKNMPTPPSKGVLPKGDTVQFVPPTAIPTTATSEIMVEPTLIGNMIRTDFVSPIGLPTGVLGPPSDGPGTGGGIGTGRGHGAGEGEGPGAGPGKGGGSGGGVYKVGGAGGASAPSCPVQVEPNYSDDARKARIQGTVVLNSIVQKDGSIDVVGVERSLGYGLDEEAKKVLKKWKCNPGKKDGQAVAVQLQIVINFRLF